jgi:hypothetical protein
MERRWFRNNLDMVWRLRDSFGVYVYPPGTAWPMQFLIRAMAEFGLALSVDGLVGISDACLLHQYVDAAHNVRARMVYDEIVTPYRRTKAVLHVD